MSAPLAWVCQDISPLWQQAKLIINDEINNDSPSKLIWLTSVIANPFENDQGSGVNAFMI